MSSKCVAQHGYAYKVARYSLGNRSSIIYKIASVWISTLESLVFTCTATQWAHPAHEIHHRSGKGVMVSPRKSVVQSPCQYDVTSRVGDFQNGEQSVHRRYQWLIYLLSILCVRLTIKVMVGIPESFKVGWYPPKKLGRFTLSEWNMRQFWNITSGIFAK